MLVEFKVANFLCFRDEICLSLVPAGQDRELRGNIWQGHRHQALKSAAIFGPNASGKTSLLRALDVFRQFVVESTTRMTIGDPIPGIDPFRLTSAHCEKPSCFELLVELNGQGYRYRVEATRDRVWREKLEHQDYAERSRLLTLIDRDVTRTDSLQTVLHDRLGTPSRRDQIVEDTRDNSLILSRAAERNVEAIVPFFRWFKDRICYWPPDLIGCKGGLLNHFFAEQAANDLEYLKQLELLVRDADTGIDRFVAERALKDRFPLELKLPQSWRGETSKEQAQDAEEFRFLTKRMNSDGELVRFELDDESTGTLRYLSLLVLLLRHFKMSSLIVIDELDSSLHPQLGKRVVQLVHSPEFNQSGAQLLFSTHDTTLMDPTLLRRDQIFLTQKKADGASELYSLWDYEQMPRNNAAWAKNYLAGRFGAVPVFGPLLADIPQADEPTKLNLEHSVVAESD